MGRIVQCLYVMFIYFYLIIWMQVSWVIVVIVKIEVIYCVGVVVDRIVIVMVGLVIGKCRWQFNYVVDFIYGVVLVCQVQGLVVNVFDSIVIFINIIIDMFIVLDWLGVWYKQDFCVVILYIQCFVQIFGLFVGVVGFCVVQSVEVVQGMCGVFGGIQGFQGWNIEVYFGWCFVIWGYQEVKFQVVDNYFFVSLDDSFSWCNNVWVVCCQCYVKVIIYVVLCVVWQ